MLELRKEKYKEKVTQEEFNERSREIKDDKEGLVVVIKPTKESTYRNLVDVLDEMQICAIGTYAIVDMTEGDEFLLKNYESKGAAFAETKK